ncbi:MAG: gluconeogenesis factor YvcK family protein [Armatimonadota bacterium]
MFEKLFALGKQWHWFERIASLIKWLYPGMRVKRWMLVVLLGALMNTIGLVLVLGLRVVDYLAAMDAAMYRYTGRFFPAATDFLGLGLAFLGVLAIFVGVQQVVRSVTSVVSPQHQKRLADVIYRRRYLASGERVVAIGGGTGLSTLLRGLKEFTSNITAIVTVTDDGGSSGRLIREFGILPPGDLRNCLVAMADEEHLMSKLLQYRFNGCSSELEGHSFGNLFLTAMTQITGDFEQAVRETGRVLAIRGLVLPSTTDPVVLEAELIDGRVIRGETAITKAGVSQTLSRLRLVPEDVPALEDAVDAILKAALVVIGPGSVYTSVVPNLLVKEIAKAVSETKAVRVYVCNVMTQPGETDGYAASDHVRAIERQFNGRPFDYVVVNTRTPAEEVLRRYAKEGAYWVRPDVDRIRQMGYRVLTGDFISDQDLVRHDSMALAKAVLSLV